MTRKQQIEQAWLHGEAENLTSFRMGAEWADAHPNSPWISVKEQLPKDNVEVLVRREDDFIAGAHMRLVEINKGKL